jgi:uncharacterized membrane protein
LPFRTKAKQIRQQTAMEDAGARGGHAFSRRFTVAACLLGFGFGGFFDGILLHQILQWHHLLSGISRGALADLRLQVMADGVFHALMYVLAGIGLVQLICARDDLRLPAAARWLTAAFVLGFGSWHVIDAIVSHWLTGIHRIRMDSSRPLLWDLTWFVIFGLAPIAVSWRLHRAATTDVGADARIAGLLLAVATGVAAAWAARPPDVSVATVVVVLRPDVRPARLLTALNTTSARIVWSDRAGTVWVLRDAEGLKHLDLYRHGAMFVSGTVVPAGCAAWAVNDRG